MTTIFEARWDQEVATRVPKVLPRAASWAASWVLSWASPKVRRRAR